MDSVHNHWVWRCQRCFWNAASQATLFACVVGSTRQAAAGAAARQALKFTLATQHKHAALEGA